MPRAGGGESSCTRGNLFPAPAPCGLPESRLPCRFHHNSLRADRKPQPGGSFESLAHAMHFSNADSARSAANDGTDRFAKSLRAERIPTMRLSLRGVALTGLMAIGLLTVPTRPASAQGYGGYGQSFGSGIYGQSFGRDFYGRGYSGGYSGGGYAPSFPVQQYYGNGGHDFTPHGHQAQTPIGSFGWYGNGAHDLAPHENTQSYSGGYQGYSPNPFGGVTTSYYNSTPYIYRPW